MSVSSKWYVSRIDGQTVYLYPVCRGIENREWATATPGGQMSMVIQNEAALEQFKLYEEYEAVFVHKPKPAPGDKHPVSLVTAKSFEGTPAEKTVYLCGTCGNYARLDNEGNPDWSAHDELYGLQLPSPRPQES